MEGQSSSISFFVNLPILWVTAFLTILQADCFSPTTFIGTLVCHKTTTSKINHTRKEIPVEERFRHENYAPVIIEKDKWEQVQFLLQQKELIIEKIRDRKNSDIYDELLKKCEESIRLIQEEISAMEDYETTVKKRKSEIKSVVELIDDVLSDGAISDANLRLLVNKIIITEEGDKLDVHIKLNAKFTAHTLMYDENGKMTDVMLSA